MIQKHIEWGGIEEPSFEKCLLTFIDAGISVRSVIVGKNGNVPYRITYEIELDKNWMVRSFEVYTEVRGIEQHIAYATDTQGHWTKDGQQAHEFDGCLYIDIFPTPFTNSLPINHLNMEDGESRDIKVMHIDIPAEKIQPKAQRYKKLSPSKYIFENIPNDFEVVITVDEDGLVSDYPGLFKMI